MPRDVDDHGRSDPRLDVRGVLHDVSNALTVLLGWVAEARDEGGSPEARAHALAMVEQRARIARDLARRAIGGAPGVIDREEALDGVLDDVLGALAVLAAQSGVTIERGAAPGTSGRSDGSTRVPAAGDMAQILTNLLMNALAWAPRGSRITVDVTTTGQHVVIEVRDEGPGIDETRASAVFHGDSTREGGAGIGLRHAREVARSAGGDLELVQRDEQGARLRLTWPCSDALAPMPPPSTPRPLVLSGTRVLVLEDDTEVATLLETALGARGAEVSLARSAQDLVSLASANGPEGEPDAALLDLSPIAANVEGTLAGLRERFPTMALVIISGSVDGPPEPLTTPALARDTPRAPVRWVRKPFEVSEVVSALTEVRAARKKRAIR